MKQLGTVVHSLGPKKGNPRNSEGAFLQLKDGRLMFAYSRYTGESASDIAPCCIAAIYSGDEGDTWTEEETIARAEEHDVANIMSVSLLRMQNGDIGLFYFIRRARNDGRLYLRRSSDEGKSWGDARVCVPGLGHYVTNNDRVVMLSSGRLIVPAAYHKMAGDVTEYDEFKSKNDAKAVAHFFLSDDDGFTWREAQSYCALYAPRSRSGLQEPGVIELENGTLWAWARTDLGCQYEMFSMDGGETWSQAAPSLFSSPRSPLSMKRCPRYGFLLAIWNPIPHYQTRAVEYHRIRSPLVGAISKDEGQSWDGFFTLETEDSGGGYCYTAIHFVGEAVLLAYCAGIPKHGESILSRISIRKIQLSEIV